MQPLQRFALDDCHARAVMAGSTVVRWYTIGLVGVVGLISPPPVVTLLASWIVGVAAYNSLLLWVTPSATRAGWHLLGLVVVDALSFFMLIAIYAGTEPEKIYAIFVWVLLEAILGSGVAGVGAAFALFVVDLVTLRAMRVTVFHLPLHTNDAAGWIIIMAVTSGCLVMAQRMLARARWRETGAQDATPSPAAESVGLTPREREVLGLLAQDCLPDQMALPAADIAAGVHLTKREQEVLLLIASGYSNAMIACRLCVAESTVKGHVHSIFGRLNARNRAEAVTLAARLHLTHVCR